MSICQTFERCRKSHNCASPTGRDGNQKFVRAKKLRQEFITLILYPDPTQACILPRTDLKSSHVMIEKMVREKTKKHLVADKEHVQLWLSKFFNKEVSHDSILQMQRDS